MCDGAFCLRRCGFGGAGGVSGRRGKAVAARRLHRGPALRGDEKTLKAVTTGQVFTASQALQYGLVDRIGFIEDAILRAIAMAKLDQEAVRVVKYTQQLPGVLEMLAGSEARGSSVPGLDVGRLMDLTAPRAYYLCTWLPSVLSNSR